MIHISIDGQTEKTSEEEALHGWKNNQYPKETLCWKSGMEGWIFLSHYFTQKGEVKALKYTLVKPEIKSISIWLTRLLYSLAAVYAALMLLGVMMPTEIKMQANNQAESMADIPSEVWTFGIMAAIVGLALLLVTIGTMVLFPMWTHHACKNSHGFEAQGMKHTPGWSAGYYFIPIVHLFMPYRAVKEIWKVSIDPQNWQSQEVPNTIRFWWAFWITSFFSGQITTLLQLPILISAIINGGIMITACYLAAKVIKTITENQQELVQK